MVTLRGFARRPQDRRPWQTSMDCVRRRIAVYPMYKGLARLVGMDDGRRRRRPGRADRRRWAATWHKYDFFFLHYKYTDSTGEDGTFHAKVQMIEEFDAEIPRDRRA